MQAAEFQPTLAINQGRHANQESSQRDRETPPVSPSPNRSGFFRRSPETVSSQNGPVQAPHRSESPQERSTPKNAESGRSEARLRRTPHSYPAYQAGAVVAMDSGPGAPPTGQRMTPLPCGTSPLHPTVSAMSPGGASASRASPIRRQTSSVLTPKSTTPSSRALGVNTPSSNRFGDRPGSGSKIDPEQVPRPTGQPEAVKEEGGKTLDTAKYGGTGVPPPAGAVCTIMDSGSCSCEFIRCTVNQVLSYPSTANTAHVPVAVVVQPFAELTAHEAPVPVLDLGESGPLRCTRCRAYANAFFTWVNRGRDTVCNFCGQRMEVPNEYFCSLDEHGQRRDLLERPEFQRGTVDYLAPRDYSEGSCRAAPSTVVVIDSSQRSMQTGFFQQVLVTLRSLLPYLRRPASRLGIVTFDRELQFYRFNPAASEAWQVTVADLEDPFMPCGADVLCVDVEDESVRAQFEALLDRLPKLVLESRPAVENGKGAEAAGGAALKAAVEMMAEVGGGHVLMCHAVLPAIGVGALRSRGDVRLYGSAEEEAGLFAPQQGSFFDSLVKSCLDKGVAVSTICAPAAGAYIDAASLSVPPRRTGGEFLYFPGFDVSRDGERLHFDISRSIVQNSVFGCVFKLRCSKGLSVETMYALWDAEVIDSSTFHVSRLSVDAACAFVLTHSERIEGAKHAYVQAACLHTNRNGQRLIRVHTLKLPVATLLSSVFRFCEIDAVTNLLLKQAVSLVLSGTAGFKDKLTKACVDILHAYRIHCAATTSAGQLILPESLKLLPLYISSIRKMSAFRSGSDIKADERVASLLRLLGLGMAQTSTVVYPRVFPMVPLADRAGRPTGVGDNVHYPATIPCSQDKLNEEGVYLVDNGFQLQLYVGPEVQQDTFDFFGISSLSQLPTAITRGRSDEVDRMLSVVDQIRKDRHRLPWLPLVVILPGSPEEAKLLSMMVEDRVAGEMHYVDFLCHIHKLVHNKLD